MFLLGLQQPGKGATVMDVLWTLAIVAVALAVYFAPTLLALHRKVTNTGSVLVINLFLGWTLIGWVVALAMAARTVKTAEA